MLYNYFTMKKKAVLISKALIISVIICALFLTSYYFYLSFRIEADIGSPELVHPLLDNPILELMLPVLFLVLIVVFPVLTIEFYILIKALQERKK